MDLTGFNHVYSVTASIAVCTCKIAKSKCFNWPFLIKALTTLRADWRIAPLRLPLSRPIHVGSWVLSRRRCCNLRQSDGSLAKIFGWDSFLGGWRFTKSLCNQEKSTQSSLRSIYIAQLLRYRFQEFNPVSKLLFMLPLQPTRFPSTKICLTLKAKGYIIWIIIKYSPVESWSWTFLNSLDTKPNKL